MLLSPWLNCINILFLPFPMSNIYILFSTLNTISNCQYTPQIYLNRLAYNKYIIFFLKLASMLNIFTYLFLSMILFFQAKGLQISLLTWLLFLLSFSNNQWPSFRRLTKHKHADSSLITLITSILPSPCKLLWTQSRPHTRICIIRKVS